MEENEEEIEKTINELDKAMEFLGNLNVIQLSTENQRKYNQIRIHKAYDTMFKLRNHLKFILKRQGKANEEEL